MAFADPLIITINAVAKSLPRINPDNYGSEYFLREATQEFRVKIRNSSYVKAGVTFDRHSIEFTQVIYATTTSAQINRKIYTTIENLRSDTDAGLLQSLNGYVAVLTSANLQKMLNYES